MKQTPSRPCSSVSSPGPCSIEQPQGLKTIDPYGDQSGDLFESFEDLVGETYDTLERGAQIIDEENDL